MKVNFSRSSTPVMSSVHQEEPRSSRFPAQSSCQRRCAPMVFGIIPECRSASLRNTRSASPESPRLESRLHFQISRTKRVREEVSYENVCKIGNSSRYCDGELRRELEC